MVRSIRGRRLASSGIAALFVGISIISSTASAAAGSQQGHELRPKGAQQASSGNLIDNGGKILPASRTYLIFWGHSSSWSADVMPGLENLFGGFNGSNYLGIGTQYMRGAAVGSTFVTALSDTSSSPPRKAPSTNAVAAEVGRVLAANGLATDPNALYLVYTANFPSHVGFCAWHSGGVVNGVSTQFAYMPNTGLAGAGCDPGNLYGVSGSEDLRSLANVSAHEFMETVTDPQLNAWFDSAGAEIGDKCAWRFSGKVTLKNGTSWQLQEEWSNAVSGCAQGQ